jgi:hypothetical protein
MWDFIKSWKFMAIIIGIFTAVVVGLVIFGVVTHTEAGLDPNFNLIPDEVTAGQLTLPIGVCPNSYTSDPHTAEVLQRVAFLGNTENAWTNPTHDDAQAVADAVDIINQRLGRRVLRAGDDCLIHVNVGVPLDPSWRHEPGGRAWRCHDSCCIETANTGTSEMLSLALQHELGHCLGLADETDVNAVSIMAPDLHPTGGGFPPRITDSDRSLLLGIYH